MSAPSDLSPTPSLELTLAELERTIDALDRAWVGADDPGVEAQWSRGRQTLRGSLDRTERERLETSLAHLEQARQQARMRVLTRH